MYRSIQTDYRQAFCLGDIAMRAEIVAYMIYLEGLEYPEYVMHFLPRVFLDPQMWEYVR